MESIPENVPASEPVGNFSDSILTSIKKLLGITEDYTQFDLDLILHINSTFSILTQLGIGPESGFSIESASKDWSDYMDPNPKLDLVKSYMYLKVKLLFDPPLSTASIESYNRMISEFANNKKKA